MKPAFPIKVEFKENGEKWILDDEIDASLNLEWFNSDDPDENAIVTDKNGRNVRLIVEKLKIILCEIVE